MDVTEQTDETDKDKKKIGGTLRLKNFSYLKKTIDGHPPVKQEVIDLEEDEVQVTSMSAPVVI